MLERIAELLAMPEESCGNHPRAPQVPCFPPLPRAGDLARRVAVELDALGICTYVVPTCDRGFLFEPGGVVNVISPGDAPPDTIAWRGHVGIFAIWIDGDGVSVSVDDADLTIDLDAAP